MWRRVDGYLAVSTIGGEALEAAGPAGNIWQLLDDWITVDEMSRQLADRHHADLDQVRNDVAAFIDELIEGGYVERNGKPDG